MTNEPEPPPAAPAPALPDTIPGNEGLRFGGWIWLMVLAPVFVALVVTSWRKWADPIIDYGLQVYVPWQLSTGKVLYRDVMYLAGGPLSQYFHAVLFKIFGVSMTTLIAVNLGVVALLIGLIHHLFLRIADQWTAVVIGLATLVGFSFSQYSPLGNYNYVCPYTYETVHGLALSVAGMACLWRWIVSGKRAWAFAAGLCVGGVFLTKPDLFLAIAAATLAALAMAYLSRSNNGKGRFSIQLLVLVAGALVPSAVFMAYYAQVWQAREGLRAVTAAWLPVLTTSASDNNFYRWCMGLDAPGANLLGIIKYTGGFVACVSFLALCAQRSHRNKAVATGFGALLLGLLYLAYARFDWMMCGRVFGPVTLCGCGFLAWRWWRKRAEPGGNGLAFPVLWSVFALFLLAKMALAARIWQYGFYLGMPAAVLIVFLLLWTLPAELERYGLNRKMFRLLNTIFILAGLLRLATVSQYLLGQKSLPVGTGGDRLITEGPQLKPDGFGVKLALAWLKENTAPANTLAVLPEGVMVNYLSRHANPTPYTVFCLPEVRAYGESNMLYALKEAGPDYVLLIHRDASEYGVNFFGLEPGYGHDIMNWVHDNYSSLWIYGHEPLKTNAFGIQMLVRHVPAVRPRNESKPDAGALTPVPAAETPEQVR